MATSTPGIGSGLDVNSIVNQLVSVERQPLQKLQQRATTIQTQISSWGKLKGLIDTLRTASTGLSTSGTWSQMQVTSSDTAVVAATKAGAETAAPGRYGVTVAQLAQQHVINSAPIASTEDLRGRLRIELGTYDTGSPPGFTPRGDTAAIQLDFTDPSTSLSTIRDAINAASGGVSASVITDSSGSRLVVTSTETGRDRAIRMTVSSTTTSSSTSGSTTGSTGGTGGLLGSITSGLSGLTGGTTTTTVNPTGLNALQYDGSSNAQMTQARAAQDAMYAVNGVSMTSSRNQVDGAITGVRLQLSRVTTNPIDVVVQSDTGGQQKSVDEFVTAYNAVMTQLNADTSYDSVSGKGGVFQGDSGVLSVRRRLRELVSQSSTASGTYTRLAEIGLDIRRDGTISINKTKLDSAMTNRTEVEKLLSASGSGSEDSKGLVVRLKALADTLLSSDGDVEIKSDSLQDRLKRNRSDQDRLNARIESTRSRLLRLYQSLDTRVAQLNGLGGYVQQQFGNRG
jgi:flagellar hook-associated protein 2